MILKDFLDRFKKFWPWLLAAILLTAFLGALWGGLVIKPFKSAVSVDVVFSGVQEISDYKYDGYYAILAADEFSKSIQFWLKNQKTIIDVFALAQINGGSLEPKGDFFKVKKLSPQYLEVEYSTQEFKQAEAIAMAIQEVLSKRSQEIKERSGQSASFDILVQEPLIWRAQKTNILNGFLMGCFMGIILSLLVIFISIKPESFKS